MLNCILFFVLQVTNHKETVLLFSCRCKLRMMEVYHYILGFTIFLFAVAFAESDKPTGLSQGSLWVPQNNYFNWHLQLQIKTLSILMGTFIFVNGN